MSNWVDNIIKEHNENNAGGISGAYYDKEQGVYIYKLNVPRPLPEINFISFAEDVPLFDFSDEAWPETRDIREICDEPLTHPVDIIEDILDKYSDKESE